MHLVHILLLMDCGILRRSPVHFLLRSLLIQDSLQPLARISHQNDKPSLDLCSHKEFSSFGKTARIPLSQKIPCENKSLPNLCAIILPSGEKCGLADLGTVNWLRVRQYATFQP